MTRSTSCPAARPMQGYVTANGSSRAATRRTARHGQKWSRARASQSEPMGSRNRKLHSNKHRRYRMTRQELVKAVAERAGHSQTAVNEMLNAMIGTIQDTVAAGDKVVLVGFGAFEPVSRPERDGRNPQTGAKITIAASTTPKFTPGKAFKDAVNQGGK
ncbi:MULTISPECIES: HU family DNA-binding protein [Stutzerimonas stutzeri group]